MSEEKLDPDLKINMSLDQIIRLDKSLQQAFRKKWRRKRNLPVENHSVPILSSLGGGFIYVSKNSPLLYERRRRLMENERNRLLNSDLVKMSKEVIPACYHLIKTDTGVEKVLLPVRFNNAKKKKTGKRKGQWSRMTSESRCSKEGSQLSTNDSDDDVVVLYSSMDSPASGKKEPMDVDVDSMSYDSVWSNVGFNNFVPQRQLGQTLNDRFRSLSSSTLQSTPSDFQF